MKKTLKEVFGATENILGFIAIAGIFLGFTGYYKALIPKHSVINKPAVYLCKNQEESHFCDFTDEKLPSIFDRKITCNHLVYGKGSISLEVSGKELSKEGIVPNGTFEYLCKKITEIKKKDNFY